jgi:hypothetical protein
MTLWSAVPARRDFGLAARVRPENRDDRKP